MKKNLFTFLFLTITLITQAQLISDGLQAYYKFDNNIQDATSNGYNLTPLGSSLNYSTIYQSDYGIDFINNNGVRTNFNTTNYTGLAFSMWLKTSQIKSYNQTIIQGAYMGFGIHIDANTGKIGGFFNGTSAGAYSSSNLITDNQWHIMWFFNLTERQCMFILTMF